MNDTKALMTILFHFSTIFSSTQKTSSSLQCEQVYFSKVHFLKCILLTHLLRFASLFLIPQFCVIDIHSQDPHPVCRCADLMQLPKLSHQNIWKQGRVGAAATSGTTTTGCRELTKLFSPHFTLFSLFSQK